MKTAKYIVISILLATVVWKGNVHAFGLKAMKNHSRQVLKDTSERPDAKETLAGEQAKRVNVVFILTDNQGAWTLGCYGNPDIRTPNIDRLAKKGIMYTRALSSNPVCSPTRATFLTGLIPSQHGIHSFLDQKYQMGPEAYNAIAEFQTLPEILSKAGYVCGLTGKWHLGDNINPGKGFSYWVTKPDGGTGEFYEKEVIEDGKVRLEKGYTTDFWTEKAVNFIEENKDRPFFLMLAYNGPYNLSNSLMLNPARNRWADYYKGKYFKSFPVDSMHPWQYQNKGFHNKQAAMERCAAETSGVDDGVGEVMATLERLGLDSNTVVIYAADQGWMGGQNGIWGMGDHTYPIGANDLMMQIPFIVTHPGLIPAGRSSDLIVSNYDFMPTLLGYLDLDMPDEIKSPGRDFSPELRGDKTFKWFENEMFYEMETTRAIRTDKWKYVERYPNGPYELYNIELDPRERFNMYGQPGSEEKRKELSGKLQKFFGHYVDSTYDLWHGGKSKAKVHSQERDYNRDYFNDKADK